MNIIVLMLDSLRQDHVSYYGWDGCPLQTPNIDAVAAEAVVFDNVYPEGLPTIPVRTDLLTPVSTTTRCPYKGIASYWTATIGDRTFENIVWGYPDPVPECPNVKDLMCFYNEKVDAVYVDGVETERPVTKWSK